MPNQIERNTIQLNKAEDNISNKAEDNIVKNIRNLFKKEKKIQRH